MQKSDVEIGSGNEIGPFRAIEESILAHLNPPEKRSDIFAWYSLIGFAGAGTGMMVAGWTIESLQAHGWTMLESYKFTFYAYAGMGFLKFLFALSMSPQVEAETKQKSTQTDETAPLLAQETEPPASEEKWNWRSLLPQVSRESTSILIKLCLLFAVDSFASGLAPLTWQTFFFKTKFNLSEGTLGSIFFVTTLITSLSMLVSSSIAKRIGNIKVRDVYQTTTSLTRTGYGLHPSTIRNRSRVSRYTKSTTYSAHATHSSCMHTIHGYSSTKRISRRSRPPQ